MLQNVATSKFIQ